MTTDLFTATALGAQMRADAAAIIESGAGVDLTLNGVAARGVPVSYFGLVDDPRAPTVLMREADIPAGTHRKVVVIGADTYTVEALRPVAPGVVRVVLRDE